LLTKVIRQTHQNLTPKLAATSLLEAHFQVQRNQLTLESL
jgi:hypothetical protein